MDWDSLEPTFHIIPNHLILSLLRGQSEANIIRDNLSETNSFRQNLQA